MKFAAIIVGIVLLSFTVSSRSAAPRGRYRRTMGAGESFINCLAIGNSTQRICSYDLDLLNAIERQQGNGSRPCPEGKVFRRHCNVCKCGRAGAFECSTDLCGEDFFHPTGLPRYW
uniref:Pacifastin domain-containing protein n=2 Tax=gambiae species complex TaxID=44542 RepID=A0A8W7P2B5_ANOCL